MDVCDQASYIAVRGYSYSTKSFQNQRASAARPVQPLLLYSNKCFFFLITVKDGAERKRLLSNSEYGFCNDNRLLDVLLGRAFLQLFVDAVMQLGMKQRSLCSLPLHMSAKLDLEFFSVRRLLVRNNGVGAVAVGGSVWPSRSQNR